MKTSRLDDLAKGDQLQFDAMLKMALLCLVAEQPNSTYTIKVDHLDEFPKGKKLNMEFDVMGRTFTFKVVDNG